MIAMDPATSELFTDGAYASRTRAGALRPPDGRPLARTGRPLPDRLDRGRHGRGGLGRLDPTHRRPLGHGTQLVGDDLFVTNPERLQRGIDDGVAQLDPRSRSTRSAPSPRPLRRSRSPATRATPPSSPTARARRRTRRSPTWPSAPAPARSRPARPRAPIESPSTTACCESPTSWAIAPASRAPRSSTEADAGIRRAVANAQA